MACTIGSVVLDKKLRLAIKMVAKQVHRSEHLFNNNQQIYCEAWILPAAPGAQYRCQKRITPWKCDKKGYPHLHPWVILAW